VIQSSVGEDTLGLRRTQSVVPCLYWCLRPHVQPGRAGTYASSVFTSLQRARGETPRRRHSFENMSGGVVSTSRDLVR